MSVSAYRNRNSQQLLDNTFSTVTGFNTVLENSPAVVENKGYRAGAWRRSFKYQELFLEH